MNEFVYFLVNRVTLSNLFNLAILVDLAYIPKMYFNPIVYTIGGPFVLA